MCRNIKILFNFDPPVTDEEVRAASLQFVRKVTGFNSPLSSFWGGLVDILDFLHTRLDRSIFPQASPW
jgi:hypothetical protein